MITLAAALSVTLGAASPVYALIVANNQSNDPKLAPLQFADDDGARWYSVLSPIAAQAELLTVLDADTQRRFPGLAAHTRPPTKKELFATLERLNARMTRDRAKGDEPVFYFVFTGHGQRGEAGEGSVALLGEQLTRTELYTQVLDPRQASTTHLVIDACDSYFFVNQRGSLPVAASQATAVTQFLGERSLDRYPDVGVVLSTAREQESHEWAAISAGVFSHEVISALLGAADVNADGRVEYSELRAFVAAANQRVEDPRGKVDMFARPPARDRSAPLADLTRAGGDAFVLFPAGAHGRHWVEDGHGVRFADFNKEPGVPLVLALPPGAAYFVRGNGKGARVAADRPGRVFVSEQLDWAPESLAARGGSLDESFREHLFEASYGATFYEGFVTSSGEVAVAPAARPDLTP